MTDPGKVVTQKTIAEMLDLHPTTVSMALRGVKLIAPETRKRVLDAARKLNYQPNTLARNLRVKSSNTIGLIAPSIVWWEVAQARIAATARLAHREKLDLMMYYRWPEEKAYEDAVRSLRSAQVAALIISDLAESHFPESLQHWLDEDKPVIFLSHAGPDPFNTIDTDRMEGFRMATEYLFRIGHRDIGIVMPEDSKSSELDDINRGRLAGFRKGLEEAGLPLREDRIYTYRRHADGYITRTIPEYTQEHIVEAIQNVVKASPRPTALLAYSDKVAALCIRALVHMGLSVPKDISIIGYDNDMLSQLNMIPITTMAQPVEKLAEKTVQMLVGMMRGECPKRFAPILYPPELILRETTAPPPAR